MEEVLDGSTRHGEEWYRSIKDSSPSRLYEGIYKGWGSWGNAFRRACLGWRISVNKGSTNDVLVLDIKDEAHEDMSWQLNINAAEEIEIKILDDTEGTAVPHKILCTTDLTCDAS